MDPFEVHIGVMQGLQEINANSNRDISPEAIDLAVNVSINRFIGLHLKPNSFTPKGFSGTQKDLDDISTLITGGYLRPLDIDKFELPPDYYHRLSGRGSLLQTCLSSTSTETETVNDIISFLPFNLSENPSAPYYNSVVITRESEEIFNSALDTPDSSPIKSKKERFLVVSVILDVLRSKGYSVYWESYMSVRRSGAFIFVDNTNASYSLTSDGSISNSTVEGVGSRVVYKDSTINLRPAAKLRDDEIGNFPSAFMKSDYDELLYTINDGYIQIFPDKSIIVNGFHLNYIRKPKRFSVILNQGIDLPEGTYSDIVDLTVEYLSGTINKENTGWKTQDNQVSVKQL